MKSSRFGALVVLAAASIISFAQQTPAAMPTSEAQLSEAVKELQEQIAKLQSSVSDLRNEADRYRERTQELERRLAEMAQGHTHAESAPAPSSSSEIPSSSESGGDANHVNVRVSRLEDEYGLLTGKVDDQYQTKVESGSRYRVRFSGLVMLNLFSNRGVLNSADTPGYALSYGPLATRGSFAGSLRQSQIGMEIFGPEWAGAKLSGDLRFDFAGGFPDVDNGTTLGLMRLRTGNVHFNWSHTSVTAGQDAPMFSPLSPRSVIALAEPEFSYAGNLWTWVPQVQVRHWIGLGNSQRMTFSGGILDPLTGEPPRSQFDRTPQAGEASRQPGYSARIGWSSLRNEDQPLTFTAGGYFSRQNWGFNRQVDGWAATADWQIPLQRRLAIKGEIYRGEALGGFGAAAGQSILSSDALQNRLAFVRGLDTVGGWTEANVQISPTLEVNSGFGMDNPFSNQIRQFVAVQNLISPYLGINRSAMANVIYRPRSDLLLSLEYRHFMMSRVASRSASAENVGMGIGLLF